MVKKRYAMVVDVPAIEEAEGAYNPERPISSLLLSQVRHLHAVEQQLPKPTGININQLHTELDASKYIRKVTEKLHKAESDKKRAAAPKKRAPKTRKRASASKKASSTKKKSASRKRK